MATGVLQRSTSQLAGLSTSQLAGFTAAQMSALMTSVTDLAAINDSIIDDQQIISAEKGVPNAATIQAGIILTGDTTDASAAVANVSITSPSTATIAAIQPGMYVTGSGVAAGTRILTASGTAITLSTAVVKGYTTGVYIVTGAPLSGGLVKNLLYVPNRGVLKVFPSDYIFIDTNGFPYLVPATSVGASGSGMPWIYVP